MGVVTTISLLELQSIFPSYRFTSLTPTESGIIDTTYIVHTDEKSYILKRYEREIKRKIALDTKLLKELNAKGLNVPMLIEENEGWYLYTKLHGKQPNNVKSYHIQALGRFLAKLHCATSTHTCDSNALIEIEVINALKFTKKHYFSYYKKLEFLKHFKHDNDALIHGDIFKDNTIFDNHKIGVIDFIDSSCGTLSYDGGVALIGFDATLHSEYFINIFLKSYNQHAPKKLSKKVLKEKMKVASHFYALKRIYKYKNTFRAKELLV